MEGLANTVATPNGPGGANDAASEAALQAEFDNAIVSGSIGIASIYLMDVVNAIQDTKYDPE